MDTSFKLVEIVLNTKRSLWVKMRKSRYESFKASFNLGSADYAWLKEFPEMQVFKRSIQKVRAYGLELEEESTVDKTSLTLVGGEPLIVTA